MATPENELEIVSSDPDDRETEAPKPAELQIVTGTPDFGYNRPMDLGESESPGFWDRVWPAMAEWRRKQREGIKPFTREEAREITKQNIALNREIMGNRGFGQFSFGSTRAPSHSSLVRAGLEEPPEDPAEQALTPWLRDDPNRTARPTPEQTRLAQERFRWQFFPKDPSGFLIDPTRPVLLNPDGSQSTEQTITIQDQTGRWWNLPSIVGGKQVSEDEALRHANSQMKKGWIYPHFQSREEAEYAAQQRSEAIMPARQQLTSIASPREVTPSTRASGLRLRVPRRNSIRTLRVTGVIGCLTSQPICLVRGPLTFAWSTGSKPQPDRWVRVSRTLLALPWPRKSSARITAKRSLTTTPT